MERRGCLRPKWRRVGFEESAINLLLETMSKRRIKVKIGSAYSEEVEVDVGLAEGGILSPGTVFNFLMCDLPAIKDRVQAAASAGIRTAEAMMAIMDGQKTLEETEDDIIKVPDLKIEPTGYADDNGFISTTESKAGLRAAAWETDRQVLEFFEVNGMAPNRSKSEAISFLNCFSIPVKVGCIESQDSIKLLGLRVTDKLSFMPQAKEVVRKVTAKLPAIERLRSWASRELLIRTADSLLISHFRFLLQIWGGENRVQVLLQRCLNKVMRTVLNKEITDRIPVRQMLLDLGWDSIPNLVRYRTVFWMRKIDREAAAPYLWRLLSTGHNKTYQTRNSRLDVDFRPQTLVTSGMFVHRGLKLYNEENWHPVCLDFDDFKEQARERILRRYPNGNI